MQLVSIWPLFFINDTSFIEILRTVSISFVWKFKVLFAKTKLMPQPRSHTKIQEYNRIKFPSPKRYILPCSHAQQGVFHTKHFVFEWVRVVALRGLITSLYTRTGWSDGETGSTHEHNGQAMADYTHTGRIPTTPSHRLSLVQLAPLIQLIHFLLQISHYQ